MSTDASRASVLRGRAAAAGYPLAAVVQTGSHTAVLSDHKDSRFCHALSALSGQRSELLFCLSMWRKLVTSRYTCQSFHVHSNDMHCQTSNVPSVMCTKGNELCLLSEGVGSLPHPPTPSLLQAGVLPKLLLDPSSAPLDYINVAAVTRSGNSSSDPAGEAEGGAAGRFSSEKSQRSVQNSLHSFRVVTTDS